MAETIDYDQLVVNLIPELSKTGHVTHTRHTKTSVTFHHNGANLTHAGILAVWRTRQASAHFDVDARGRVAQFVRADEYAWAVGNRGGNESSISIEMANSTFAPKWEVSEVTWKEAARLAGWLFANVIKEKPTKNNVHYHHDWSATECPGPFMDGMRTKMLGEVQKWHAHFTEDDKTPSSPRPSTPGKKKTIAAVAKDVIAGEYGNGDERKAKLKAEGYDPVKVQAEVNKQLGHKGGSKSVHTLALEVLAGRWGNGDERKSRLSKSGYDYDAVQKEVNRLA